MERIDFSRYLKGGEKGYWPALKLILLGLVLVLLALNYFQLRAALLSSREELKRWEEQKVELEKRLAGMDLLEKQLEEKREQLNFFKEKIPENNLNELTWELFFNMPEGVYLAFFRADKKEFFVLEGYLETENKKKELEENLSLVLPEKKMDFILEDSQTKENWKWFVLEVKPGGEEDLDG